ncbi:MAG: 3-deoxy-manno-octulosonate cytidylyltransferase [Proteobacteria bacterium]|jgi:3-deoxy-manno-octulosonate cytidylyltransferase (CMP-KDO synthetase)|nr:3-deoxy-manno-octulosonate cytidylyltransferase [Candidatus Fonsibacter sp. PEL5]NKA16521.1 3-deoxy-manno-octulosonate cytidylyltransferase [Candidatus Fonsibacter sp. PEL55]
MNNTVILIPSHLRATRLPNKPLLLINNKPMIVHCWQRAIESKIGDVYVATADEEIAKVIKDVGGKSILTNKEHKTGSDRIFEAIEKNFSQKPKNIINVQGDMPNIDPSAIKLLDKFMKNNFYQIATLATKINSIKDLENKNIVKVETKKEMQINNFDNALDFFRLKNINAENFYYHHVGIYGYQYETLKKFISLKRSDNEISRSLEQMRAMDNNISISVGLTDSYPLGVDTIEDLEEIRNIMKND